MFDTTGAFLPTGLVFVDSSIEDYPGLIESIGAKLPAYQTSIYTLDALTDGVQQISQTLALYREGTVSSIHVFSHGEAGQLQLGTTALNSHSLSGYRDDLLGWQSALTTDADLLFYGCNVAQGDDGRSFIDQLSTLTSADVTASNNVTGNVAYGGDDWLLEYQTGAIEAQSFTGDTSLKTTLGRLTFTSNKLLLEDAGLPTDNRFSIEATASQLIITDTNSTSSLTAGTGISDLDGSGNSITVAWSALAGMKTFEIDTGSGHDSVTFKSNLFLSGANLDVTAETITVQSNITISTRQVVAGSDHTTAASIGNSGRIYFTGKNPIDLGGSITAGQSVENISIGAGAKLLTHVEASATHKAADIWLNARYFANADLENLLPTNWPTKTTAINIGENAVVKAANIIIKSQAEDKTFSELIGADSQVDNFVIGPLQNRIAEAVALPVKLLVRQSEASVTVNSGVQLLGSAGVSVEAVATTQSKGLAKNSYVSVGYVQANATARVNILGGVTINAGEAVKIGSEGNAEASIKTQTEGTKESSFGLSLAIDHTNIVSHTTISQGATIVSGKTTNVVALGNNTTEAGASSKTSQAGKLSFGFGITLTDTDIKADVDGVITANQNPGAIVKLELDPTRAVTYDFNPTNTVNAGNNTLDLTGVSHALRTGDKVKYSTQAGSAIGLTNNQQYYVAVDTINPNLIRFTNSRADAVNGTNFVNLTGPGALGNKSFAVATEVDSTRDLIKVNGDTSFTIGQAVVYQASGANIVGLVDGQTYYVVTYGTESGKQLIQLANAEAEARQGIVIDINAAGASGNHSLKPFHQLTTLLVDVETDTIDLAKVYGIHDPSITPHALATGDQITYTNRRGTSIGGVSLEGQFGLNSGLVDGGSYFIVTDPNNPNIIRLAPSELKALEAYAKLEASPLADLTGLVMNFTNGVTNSDGSTAVAAVNSKTFDPTQTGIVFPDKNTIILDNPAFQGDDFFGTDANFSILGSTFSLGQAVVYQSGGGRPIGGLESGKTYYVITATSETNLSGDDRFASKQIIQLAETENKAKAGIALALDPTSATGSTHSLTAAHVIDSGLATGIGVIASLSTSDTATAESNMNDGPEPSGPDASFDVLETVGKIFSGLVNKPENGNAAQNSTAGGNTAGSGGTGFSVSGALGFAYTNHDVLANVGRNAVLKSGEDLEVTATIGHKIKLNADSDIAGAAKTSGSAAVVVGIYNDEAKAIVNSNAKLDADRATRVIAEVKYPYLTRPDEYIPMNLGELVDLVKSNGYGAVNDYMDGTLGLKSKLLNTWARSTASGENIGISGSLNLLIFNNTANAIVAPNVAINQDLAWRTRKPDLQDQSVSVEAANYMQLLNLTGVFQFALPSLQLDFLKGQASKQDIKLLGADGKSGIGGAFFLMFLTNTTQALVDTGSKIFSGDRGGFNMKAEEAIMNFNFTQSGGKANGSYGIAGTFAYVNQDSTTVARLAEDTDITGRSVTIYAGSLETHINWAGGVAVGKSLGFGVTVAINDIDRNTFATVGKPNPLATGFNPSSLAGYPAPSIGTRLDVTDFIKVDAKSDGWLGAFSVAAAVADGNPKPPTKAKTGDTGSGGAATGNSAKPTSAIGLSGNVSYNQVTDHVQALVYDAGLVRAKLVDITALNETDLYAIGGAVAFAKAAPGKTSVGLAGAAGWNEVGGTAKAYMYGQGSGQRLTLTADQLRVDAKSDGNIFAITAGGSGAMGGQTNVSLAGSFSYNQINQITSSFVEGVNATLSSGLGAQPVQLDSPGQVQTHSSRFDAIAFANSLGWTTGTAVRYDNGGGNSIVGLNTSTTYYVVVDPTNSKLLRLASDSAGTNLLTLNPNSATGNGHRLYLANTPTSTTVIDLKDEYGWSTGDAVVYSSGNGQAIGNLEDGETYYVIKVSDTELRLAKTSGGSAIIMDFTKATGGQHSLHRKASDGNSYSLFEFTPIEERAFALAQVETTEVIALAQPHGFTTGQALTYDNGGGTSLGGLTHGSTYYAIVEASNPNRFRLAKSEFDAALGFAISLDAAVLTGTNHQFLPQAHRVKAEDTSSIFSIAGTASVSLGSTQSGGGFGFGFAWNDIQNSTEAVIKTSQLEYANSLQVLAQNDSKIQTVSASVGVSQAQQTAATIAGTASVNQIDNLTRAQVIGSTLRGLSGGVGGATRILAQDQATIQSVSGAVSVAISGSGASLGFGAAVAYNAIGHRSGHHTLATVENSTLTVDSLTVKATGEQLIQSIAASVAAAVSGKAAVSLAGAVTINDLEGLRIQGSITGSTVTTVKAIQVSADNRSEINSIAGQVAIAIGSKGGGALGAAVAVNDIGDGTDPVQVSAFIGSSTVTSTTGAIDVLATSSAKIWTISAGVQAAGGAAFGGSLGVSLSLNTIETRVSAYIANNSAVTAETGLTLKAEDQSLIQALAGQAAIAVGKIALAIGTAIAENDIKNTITAYIADSTAQAKTGSLTVSAKSTATIESLSAVGAVSAGKFSGSAAVPVSHNQIRNTIEARLTNAAMVSGAAGVSLLASDESTIKSLSGGAAIAISIGVGAGVASAYNNIDNTVRAYSSASNLSSSAGNVLISADARGTIQTIAASFGASGIAGVAGSIAINEMANQVTTYSSGGTITAWGSVGLFSQARNSIDTKGGSIGGGAVGAGGTVVVNNIDNQTKAYSLGTTITARGQETLTLPKENPTAAATTIRGLGVVAINTEDIEVLVGTASLGGIGLAATVAVNSVQNLTEASIQGGSVNANLADGHPDQSVLVNAYNNTRLDVTVGAVALGGSAAVGASLDASTIKNTTSAFIGANTTVNANRDITVKALAEKTVDSLAVAGGGGGIAGIAGSVSVLNVGAAISGDGRDATSGITGILTDQATEINQYSGKISVDTASVNGEFNPAATVNNATQAFVGSGATLQAGNAITVDADEITDLDIVAGAAGIGGTLGVGGAVGVANITHNVLAYVGSTAQLSANGTVSIDARSDVGKGSDATAIATYVGAAGAVGLGAGVSLLTVTNNASAYLAAGAIVTRANALNILATTDAVLEAEAKGGSIGAVAVGVLFTDIAVRGVTEAYIGNDAQVGQTGVVNAVNVEANSNANTKQDILGGGIGVAAGAGASIDTTDATTTRAQIRAGADVKTAGEITLNADHVFEFNGVVTTGAFGALAGSGAEVDHRLTSTAEATVGAGAVVLAADIDLLATNKAVKRPVGDANIKGVTGGLVSGAGADTEIVIDFSTLVNISDGAVLTATDDITLSALNTLDLYDRVTLATGGALAGAGAGLKIQTTRFLAQINVGDADLRAGDEINLSARGNGTVTGKVNVETYGAATVAVGTTIVDIKPTNEILFRAGANIRADGDLNVSTGTSSNFVRDAYTLEARTDTFAGSAIPIDDVTGRATLIQSNRITVSGGSLLQSGGIVRLHAERLGLANLIGFAKAVNWASAIADAINGGGDELVGGEVKSEATGVVRVDGTVRTGINRFQSITFAGAPDANGLYTHTAKTDGMTYTSGLRTLSSNLFDELRKAEAQLAEFTGKNTALETYYRGEITRIEAELLSQQLAEVIDGVLIPIEKEVPAITFENIRAQAGYVDVRSGQLQGSGIFDAPGDASVIINNSTSANLIFKDIIIPETNGGLRLNGVEVGSNAEINTLNVSAALGSASFSSITNTSTGNDPTITISSSLGATADLPAPNVRMTGRVENLRGKLTVLVPNGDFVVTPTASILVKDQQIVVGGSVVIDGLTQYAAGGETYSAFNPITSNGTTQASAANVANYLAQQPGSPSIYGDKITIEAEYININGIIQSGRADYQLTIGTATANEIATIDTSRGSGRVLLSTLSANTAEQLANIDPRTPEGQAQLKTLANQSINKPFNVYYNIGTREIEVDPLSVSGGNIELIGRVLNSGNGELRALGGFGEIDITNQTIYDVVINGLDASKRGVGTILINDKAKGEATLYKKDAAGVTVTVNSNPATAGSNSMVYQPQNGWRYGWSVNTTEATRTTTTYGVSAWLGIDFLALDPDDIVSGPTTERLTGPVLSDEGPYYYRDANNSSQYDFATPVVTTTSNKRFLQRKWQTSTWYGKKTYYQQWVQETGTLTTYTHTVEADRDIKIAFLGYNSAAIDITSTNSNADVIIAGQIRNSSGDSTITSQGAILQRGDDFFVGGQTITLNARTGIGPDLAVNTALASTTGSVKATSATGNVKVNELFGNLRVDQIIATAGDVSVSARDSVVVANGKVGLVQGNRVELAARDGSIGTSETNTLIVESNGEDRRNYVTVNAKQNVYLTERTGNLRLNSLVAETGDAYIKVLSGSVIDANSNAVRDERTYQELLNTVWADLQLTDGTGASAKIQSTYDEFAAIKVQEYQAYWRYRQTQADGGLVYDANFAVTLTASEDNYYRTRLNYDNAAIQALEDKRTAEYHSLHGQYITYGNTYNAGFTYTLTQAEQNAIRGTIKVWTEDELLNLISGGLLKPVSDTQITIEDLNLVAGGDVTLVATSGSIGSAEGRVTIADLRNMTADEKVLLAAAERADVSFLGAAPIAGARVHFIDNIGSADTIRRIDGGSWAAGGLRAGMTIEVWGNTANESINSSQYYTIAAVTSDTITLAANDQLITDYDRTVTIAPIVADPANPNRSVYPNGFITININQREDIDVNAGNGVINATAAGTVYLGSEEDLNIGRVVSNNNRLIRLKSGQSVFNNNNDAGATTNVIGGGLVLEAGAGSVGSAASQFYTDLQGTATLTARAANDIYVVEQSGNLNLETIFARTGAANLTTVSGSIVDALNNDLANITANGLNLMAQGGTVGEATDFLEIDLFPNAVLNITAEQSIWVNELVGSMTVGKVQSNTGNVSLIANVAILDGGDDGTNDPSLPAADIIGNHISLTATLGNIGVSGNDLDLDTAFSGLGTLTSRSGLNSYLIETTGDLGINTVGTGDDYTAFILSPNRILNRNSDPSGSNVTSGKTRLFAGGDIGEDENSLRTAVGFLEGKSTAGRVWIRNDGQLVVGGLTEAEGIVADQTVTLVATSPVTIAKNIVVAGRNGQNDIIVIAGEDNNDPSDFAFERVSTSVSGSGNQNITFATNHGFTTGDAVTYSNGGGSAIGGLRDGATYYVTKVSDTTLRLAKQLGGSAIALDLAPANGAMHAFLSQEKDTITLKANKKLKAIQGDIYLFAGDDIVIEAGTGNDFAIETAADKNVFFYSDYSGYVNSGLPTNILYEPNGASYRAILAENGDIAGGHVDLSGRVKSNSLTIYSGNDPNTYQFNTVDTYTTVYAGSGDDSATITAPASSTGMLVFNAGAGADLIDAATARAALVLNGEAGNDIIYGGLANDLIGGGDGDDALYGNPGDDEIYGDSTFAKVANAANYAPLIAQVSRFADPAVSFPIPAPVVTGTGGDRIFGNEGRDIVYGEGGNDQLAGGSDDAGREDDLDILIGGGGSDAIAGDNAAINALSGEITALGTNGAQDVIFGDFGTVDVDDVLITTRNLGSDSGNDTLAGQGGNNILLGDSGTASFSLDNGPVILDRVESTAPADGGNDIITGAEGDDVILGGAGADVINGAAGRNILLGDSGRASFTTGQLARVESTATNIGSNDTITGAAGDDIILGGYADDTITSSGGNDIVLGDNGLIDYSLDTDLNTLDLIESTAYADGGNDTITTIERDDIILGGAGDDVINAAGGSNIVLGDSGRATFTNGSLAKAESIGTTIGGQDTITTLAGDDVILGGFADDTITSSGGNDIVLGDNGLIDYSLDTDLNSLDLVESTAPADGGNDTITGAEGDDVILGGAGADVINGAAGRNILLGDSGRASFTTGQLARVESTAPADGGNDTITGAAGDDVILGGYADDTITSSGGNDIVLGDNGLIDYGLDNDLDTLDLVESTAYADGGNDTITTIERDDIILGGAGDDVINAAGGRNIVIGDSGRATFTNGKLAKAESIGTAIGGNDKITTLAGDDVILGGYADDTITSTGGNDIVLGDNGLIDYSLDTDLNTLDLVESTAYADGGNDTITGAAGQDIILGGAGDDRIRGLGGADILLGDNGQLAYGIDGNFTTLDAVTTLAPTIGGNDHIEGGQGDDTILGGAQSDSILGNQGADILLGDNGQITLVENRISRATTLNPETGGSDVISGGTGTDIILGGAAGDVLRGDEDRDTILGDHGTVDFAYGGDARVGADSNRNTLDYVATTDPLLGGDDLIEGGLGDDYLLGGTGTDTVFGDGSLDTTSLAWALIGSADFNQDGKADTLWRHQTTGQVALQFVRGDGRVETHSLNTALLSLDWALAGLGDLNGDGQADMLWRNGSGTTVAWFLDGAIVVGGGAISAQVGTEWQLAGLGDLNGDRRADMLWRNTASGQAVAWYVDGLGILGGGGLEPTLGLDWQVGDLGDLNGDGKADILWRYGATGATTAWLMNGLGIIGGGALAFSPDPSWQLDATGDVNGDGKADLLWRNRATATTVNWLMNGLDLLGGGDLVPVDVQSSSFTLAPGTWQVEGTTRINAQGELGLVWRHALSGQTRITPTADGGSIGPVQLQTSEILKSQVNDPAWQLDGTADFNGDGQGDLLWRNQVSGATSLWFMNDQTVVDGGFLSVSPDTGWQIQGTGDITGDGRPDVIWRNTATGAVVYWQLAGTQVVGGEAISLTPGQGWQLQGIGDFNGDQRADFLWRNRTSGETVAWFMDGANVIGGGALPITITDLNWRIAATGDYNQDGQTDITWQNTDGSTVVWLMNGVTVTDGATLTPNTDHDLILGDQGSLYRALPVESNTFSTFADVAAAGAGDKIYGNGGNDKILGQQGADTIAGGSGDDDILGGHNVIGGLDRGDSIDGEGGADVILGDNGTVKRRPTTSTDWQRYANGDIIRDVVRFDDAEATTGLSQTGGDDNLAGGDGSDMVYGQRGDDTISGGAGDDELQGGLGHDTLQGGTGHDTILGDVGIVSRAFNADGSPRLNADGSWHRDVILTAVGTVTGTVELGATLPSSALDADVTLLTGSTGSTSLQLVTLVADGNDLVLGDDGNDQLFGQGGRDTLSGGAGNDYLEGNAGADQADGGDGDDTIIGDNSRHLPSFNTQQPVVQQGYHLIQASAGSSLVLDPFGTVVVPNLEVVPNLLQGLLPAVGLSPTLGRDHSPVPTLGSLQRNDGVSLTTLAAIVPTVVGHQSLLPGNDTLTGGAGRDTITGDNTTQVTPLRTGNAALDLETDRLIRDVQQLGIYLQDLELQRDYANRPAAQTYTLGADVISGGDGDDNITGDNRVIQGPYRVETPAIEGNLSTQVSQLRTAIGRYSTAVTGLRQSLVVNGSGYQPHTFTIGADTLSGDTGNDSLIGDDHYTFTPILAQLPYQRDSFWNYGFGDQLSGRTQPLRHYNLNLGNDSLNGGGGDDFAIGDYSITLVPIVNQAPQTAAQTLELQQSLDLLVTNVQSYIRNLHIDAYGINFNQTNQSNVLRAGNDSVDGASGNDLVIGDNATQVLPFVAGSLNLSVALASGNLDLRVDDFNLSHSLARQFQVIYRQAGVGVTQLGQDTLFGGSDNDVLFGLRDIDTLFGQDGNDYLFGGAENDALDGGSGSNVIRSGDPGRSDETAINPAVLARLANFLSPALLNTIAETRLTQSSHQLEGKLSGQVGN